MKCEECKEVLHHNDEVVFDDDELKIVDERNPDYNKVVCITCFYKEEEDGPLKIHRT